MMAKRKLTPLQAKYFAKGRPQPAFAKRLRRGKPKRKSMKVKRNPSAKFMIAVTASRGRHLYYKQHSGSFGDDVRKATHFATSDAAKREAKRIVAFLPMSISKIHVDKV